MEVGIMLFGIVVAVAVLALTVWSNKRRKEVWDDFAAANGLYGDGDVIHGTVREIDVRIFTETRGSGKNRSTWTVFEAEIPGSQLPLNLHVYREGMLSRVGKAFGGQDIELGIPEIDDRVIIKAHDEGEARAYLSRPDVSRGLHDLIVACPNVEIDAVHVKLEFSGAVSNPAAMQRSLEALVDGTRALGGMGYGALQYDGHW